MYKICLKLTIKTTERRQRRHSGVFIAKEDLRPKIHPCLYGILLMNLWKKSFVQRSAVFRLVLTKL